MGILNDDDNAEDNNNPFSIHIRYIFSLSPICCGRALSLFFSFLDSIVLEIFPLCFRFPFTHSFCSSDFLSLTHHTFSSNCVAYCLFSFISIYLFTTPCSICAYTPYWKSYCWLTAREKEAESEREMRTVTANWLYFIVECVCAYVWSKCTISENSIQKSTVRTFLHSLVFIFIRFIFSCDSFSAFISILFVRELAEFLNFF